MPKYLKCLKRGATIHAKNIHIPESVPDYLKWKNTAWFHEECFEGLGIDRNWVKIRKTFWEKLIG